MPAPKHLSGYTANEKAIIEIAITKTVDIQFNTLSQLHTIRNRIYGLRSAVVAAYEARAKAATTKADTALLYTDPLIDMAPEIASLSTSTDTSTLTLYIGRNQATRTTNDILENTLHRLGVKTPDERMADAVEASTRRALATQAEVDASTESGNSAAASGDYITEFLSTHNLTDPTPPETTETEINPTNGTSHPSKSEP